MIVSASLLALLVLPVTSSAQTTVVVSGNVSHTIPPLLWGLMYEDISHSGDGGLYAELLQNRAFQQVEPQSQSSLFPWQPVGDASISVVADPEPLSAALPNALSLEVPSGASSGQVGVSNMGYWGINVSSAWTYNASFYYRFPNAIPETPVTANISLVSASDGTIFASESVTLNASSDWAQAFTHITPSAIAPDVFNNFTVTFDAAELSGAIHMTLFSLFPPTFMDQENGMRIDITEAMIALKPSFFRFPGGNNLEGFTIATRWQWNATVGPLTDRPGRSGYWGYINTDGLGLYEYLVWIEAMKMEPIMAVYSGYSLDYMVSNETVPEDQLGPFVEQARQQIEFVVGNTSTPGGALRASLGHPEPFELNYVEVGNEDWFASDSYTYRWPAFVNKLQALYPDINFMATSFEFNPILDPTPESYDLHVYQPPSWFTLNSDQFDGFERNGTIYLEGEYAATTVSSTMVKASAEAAFMMGFERNADIVFSSSYSPLLAHAIPPSTQSSGLIQFIDGAVIPSTSYYVQQLFSVFRGDFYVPSTLADTNGNIFWSVVKQNSPASLIIKVTNAGMEPHNLLFKLPNAVASSATLVQIKGGPHDINTLGTPNAVVPKNSTIHAAQEFNFTAPSLSVSAIILPLI